MDICFTNSLIVLLLDVPLCALDAITLDRSKRREGQAFLKQVKEVKAGLHVAIAMSNNGK